MSGYINELDVAGWEGGTDMSNEFILAPSNGGWGCALSLTISFVYLAAKSDLQEGEYLFGDRGGTCDHHADSTS